ncbi:hypothetical protein AB0M46_48720 [Dactylosporangium sp. NPDC051485]|uniref:hypothetical protein n=1 Tax=Dactylosporangium sp. NPDC051485 TaxID=3154846 RepID=UPI00341D221D
MSFAVPAGAPRARPSTVSLAVVLLFAAAAIEVISVILSLLYAQKIADATKQIYDRAGMQSSNAGLTIGTTIEVVVGFIIVAILVLLGFFVGRGSQVARILTWVFGGIAFCCSLFAVGSTLFTQTFWDQARKTNANLPTYAEYERIVYAQVPGWYRPVTTVLGILLIIAILLPIILLALPASHPYFRKQQAEWEPPAPGSGPGFGGGYQGPQPGQPGFGPPPQ